jgi:rubrerythrin
MMAEKHQSPSDIGTNRTGISLSPVDSKKLIDVADQTAPSSDGNAEQQLTDLRAQYVESAPPIGTMPPPANIKGVAATAKGMMTGIKTTVLLDKIGERLAFERTGSRLYEALLDKIRAKAENPDLAVAKLDEIHKDEMRHFQLLHSSMISIGGDPTAVTPCADVTAVASSGLLQVVSDPRTTVTQSLQAILAAELLDNDGWTMLIDLANEADQKGLVSEFRKCLTEEAEHLTFIRTLLMRLNRMELHGKSI